MPRSSQFSRILASESRQSATYHGYECLNGSPSHTAGREPLEKSSLRRGKISGWPAASLWGCSILCHAAHEGKWDQSCSARYSKNFSTWPRTTETQPEPLHHGQCGSDTRQMTHGYSSIRTPQWAHVWCLPRIRRRCQQSITV